MVGALVASLVASSRAHRELAYALMLAVSFSESLPVFGAFVPGDAIILGMSALVPTGALSLWPLILTAVAGAILGDGLSFWLGRHYRRPLAGRWPFKRYRQMLTRGEEFVQRHGGKSVFVARFTPGVRAIVPVLAGILRMPPVRFYATNVLSALCWAPLHVLAGAVIGAALVVLGAVAGRLAALVGMLIVLAGISVWATRYAARRLPALAASGQQRLRAWAQRRDTWLARALLSILDPARKELPGLALLGAILVASLWLFLGVLQDVLAGDPLVRANQAVFHFLQSLRTEWGDRAMVIISELGDASVVIAVAVAVLAWFAWRRNWRGAAHAAGAVGLSSLLALFIKAGLQVPRPHPLFSGWEAFAFPSGHSAANAALYGFLAMVAGWELKPPWRLIVAIMAMLLVAAIAFSRMYLGAHWLSDVLAGLAFGTAWAAFLAIAYLRRNPPPVGAGGLGVFAGVALLAVGALHVGRSQASDLQRYAVHEPTQIMPLAEWWHGGWSELPARQLDLIGQLQAPLNFQWAGDPAKLASELAARGWTAPVPWTLRSAIAWLKPHVRLADLPVLPRLENGREEALVSILSLAGRAATSRLVLHLWRSHVELRGPGGAAVALFVGTVQEQRIDRPLWFLTTTQQIPDYDRALRTLAAGIPLGHLVQRPAARGPGWTGRVLLGRAGGAL